MSESIIRENPAHPDEEVGRVPLTYPSGIDAVVRAADAAQRGWASLTLAERCEALTAAAGRVDADLVDRLATVLAREMGKPLPDSRGEIGFASVWLGHVLRSAPRVLVDERVDDDLGRLWLRKAPFGVVAAITPWNAPVILSMIKIAPALVAGNAVVLKPSPQAPLAITGVVVALASALPPGLLQVVHGGPDTGDALVGHPLVRKIAFTGGDVVARAIGATAARAITPTVMELGGNDAAIFCDDASFDDGMFDRIVVASFATSGQVCMASKRLYVPRSRYDEFVSGFEAAAARMLVTGDPLVDGVTVGPVVSRAAQERLETLAATSADLGGEVRRLGSIDDAATFADGYFVQPRLVLGLDERAPLVCEEQFGPLVPVQTYDDLDDAVAKANDSELGLAASVWSVDEDKAFEVAARLEAGFTFINTHNRTGMTFRAPFGGVKGSGFGREYGDEGLLEYVQTCTIHAPAAFRHGAAGASATAYPGQS